MVALSAALLLATALIYTSFSASTEASKPSEHPARKVLRHNGQGRDGLHPARGRPPALPRSRPDGTESVPVSYTGIVPDPFRDGREVIVSGRAQQRHFRGRARLAHHEVPVEVHEGACTSGRRRLRLPRRRPADGALRRRLVGVRRAQRAPRVDRSRRAGRSTASPRCCVVAFGLLESAFLRSDFSFELVAEGSSTDTPTFYKLTAMWSTPGGLAAAVGVRCCRCSRAWCCSLTRRSLREIAPYATAVLGGHRRVLPAADGRLGEPVRHARACRRPRAPGSTRCCATRR